MTIRQQTYSPNTILYASDIQATADNGVVEISSLTEFTGVGAEVNVVFCKEDYKLYQRIAEGVGDVGSTWEVFSGGGGFADFGDWTTPPSTTEWTGVVGTRDEETYLCMKWVADAQLTCSKSGIVDILVVGGGGIQHGYTGGEGTAGGAGGITFLEGVYLEEGKTYTLEVGSVQGGYIRNSQEGSSFFGGVCAVGGAPGSGYYDRSAGGGACGAINPLPSSGRDPAPGEPSGGMRGQGFVGGDGTTLTRGGIRNSTGGPSGGAGPNGDAGGGWTSLPSWGQSSTVFGIGRGASGHNTTAGTGNAGASGCVIIRTKKGASGGSGIRTEVAPGLNNLAVGVVNTDIEVDGYNGKPICRYKVLIPDDKTNETEILDYANSIPFVWNKRAGDQLFVAPIDDFHIGSFYHQDANLFGDDPDNQPHEDFSWNDTTRRWTL